MKTMTAQLIQFNNTKNRYSNTLLAAIENFRSGNDRQGLDEFLAAMEDMEMILEMDRYLGRETFKPDYILPILDALSVLIKNQDIVGMVDLLEFTLYPITKELAEDDGTDHRESR